MTEPIAQPTPEAAPYALQMTSDVAQLAAEHAEVSTQIKALTARKEDLTTRLKLAAEAGSSYARSQGHDGERVQFVGDGLVVSSTIVRGFRLDTERFKREQVALYVEYAKATTSTRLDVKADK